LLIDNTATAHLPGPQNPRGCHLYLAEGCHLYIALTQLLPFADHPTLKLYGEFETAVYGALKAA
jgi:hypothetical protein